MVPELRLLREHYLASMQYALGIARQSVPLPVCRIDVTQAMAIADAFEAAPHSPSDVKVAAAYKQFAFEGELQWQFLVNAGYCVEPWGQSGQPYNNSREMQRDVMSKHIFFFLTAAGFGEADHTLDQTLNPFLKPSGVEINGTPLLVNDLLRVVHDVFGHAQEGHQFGPLGEENAWRCHSTMFSTSARRALTTETRGQNSWFNFGPQMRRANGTLILPGESGYLSPAKRDYALQKMVILPDQYVFERINDDGCKDVEFRS